MISIKQCIFVSGVHGVGKSYFSNRLKDSINLPHYSASHLIKTFDKKLFFVDKKVSDVNSNQEVLVNSIKQNVREKLFILDGHFTLLKDNETIEKIPLTTFKNLNITKVFLLLEHPNVIYNRISTRDGKELLSTEKISELQKCEKEHAILVCNTLQIPLIILENSIAAETYIKRRDPNEPN
ncbi:ATP-binding protein [Lysinibacillus tabacifolii]|uniref:AAA family ATPase n=1 Tax=Lysinibacillus tabacifolii TaxID=1173107 RepID=A0ABY2T426_9BACI|nr:ATP-binding protein [Lysinibacillus tabacifolii]TKI50562.1 AAA family ATPase [Lysinibacillus tabacifolii]